MPESRVSQRHNTNHGITETATALSFPIPLQIITEGEPIMIKNGMRPVHPGEILFEEFMKPSAPPINANRLPRHGESGHWT